MEDTNTSVELEGTSTADNIKRVPIKAVTIKKHIAIKAAKVKVTSHKLAKAPENSRKQLQAKPKVARPVDIIPISYLTRDDSLELFLDSGK